MSPLRDGIDPHPPLFTIDEPPVLTPRQQLVYEAAALAPLTAPAAGRLLHTASDCRHCTDDQPCQYADRNGREVLEALKRKGLVRRDRHHVYTRTDGSQGDLPDGF